MADLDFICLRCRARVRRDDTSRYCPRCGLAFGGLDGGQAPIELSQEGRKFTVRDFFAYGDLCNLYRCTIHASGQVGIFKIARTHQSNRHVAHEADTIQRLRVADPSERYAPFLPRRFAQIKYATREDDPGRLGCVLAYHPEIESPDSLFSLDQVRQAYPDGIDARDMAWMWRRLLTLLGFVHQQRIAHTAITPEHIVIEPTGHKLILIGWCGATPFGARPVLAPSRWREWHGTGAAASPSMDLAAAARTMSYLLDSQADASIKRHLERASDASYGAVGLLDDFDHLIEVLWGSREFRPFVMPPRSSIKELRNG